ncbi:MAG: hypothetical protein EON55_01890 [Alphaproteobacteria bacterium]|nr:MAG: hypothetical protein EON55_01890 [Alphaproteobacteria bacterium]
MIDHDEAVTLAKRVLSLRLQRVRHLPKELLGEPGWGLLLVLFIADAQGRPLTASEAAERAGASKQTAERWYKALRAFDLVAYAEPPTDGSQIVLTPLGIDAVERCMEDARKELAPRPGLPDV